MEIKIHIDCKFKTSPPVCEFSSMHSKVKKTLQHSNIISLDFDLQPHDNLQINFINKDDYDDNVVIIKKIFVDDINLQHFIYNGVFRPIYNKDWFDKQDPTPPLQYSPCTELRHQGTWNIQIELPIWNMVMKEWLNDTK
tara:strand:- start:85 stop:501 length:417 start_codon:yes stop_codon:yes gene_type:complete